MTFPVSTIDSLNDRSTDLLAAVAAALATTDAGTPDRQFISPGIPAFDCCPFICVHPLILGLADTSPLQPTLEPALRAHRTSVNLVTLHAYIVRCVPNTEKPPSAAALTASGKQTSQDAWATWNHLKKAVRDGTLFPTDCATDVFFDGGIALVPQGGCGGWVFTIRVELPGIPA